MGLIKICFKCHIYILFLYRFINSPITPKKILPHIKTITLICVKFYTNINIIKLNKIPNSLIKTKFIIYD